MNESQIWRMYHKEIKVREELEEKFLDTDDNASQLRALAQLERQNGRIDLLRELAALAYIEEWDQQLETHIEELESAAWDAAEAEKGKQQL